MPKTSENATATEKAVARRTQWRNLSVVNMTEKGLKNPKKAGTAAFTRYEGYLGFKGRIAPKGKGVSVSELMAVGVRMDDIRHDVSHGHITLNQPFELRGEPASAEAANA